MDLKDFAERQKINKKIKYISNPNLLDNWYFVKPINQLRNTTYNKHGCCINRWWCHCENSENTITVNNGIIMTKTTQDYSLAIKQQVRNASALAGKTVTISVLCESDPGNNLMIYVSNASQVSENGTHILSGECVLTKLKSVTVKLPESLDGLNVMIYMPMDSTATIKVLAAKLELGNAQTLAHQENGEWILNEIPNYAEQMAICSQYSPNTGEFLGVNKSEVGWSVIRKYNESDIVGQNFYPFNTQINKKYAATITKTNGSNAQAVLSFNEFGIVLSDRTGEVYASYNIFGQHNKPSGNYTGNGDATSREIIIPNLGVYGAVLIKSGTGCIGIVYAWGAFFINVNGNVVGLTKSVICIETGKMLIKGDGLQYNNNGTKYYYQVL